MLDVNRASRWRRAGDPGPHDPARPVARGRPVVDRLIHRGALEAGLAVYQGKALVNSVTGEEERLERVLPLIKKYGAAVVAISNDDTGISMDPDVGTRSPSGSWSVPRITASLPGHRGRSPVMPSGHWRRPAAGLPARAAPAGRAQGQLDLWRINVSFGLPSREGINAGFLAMAMSNGLTSASQNPLLIDVKRSIMAADVLLGTIRMRTLDPDVPRPVAEGEAAGGSTGDGVVAGEPTAAV